MKESNIKTESNTTVLVHYIGNYQYNLQIILVPHFKRESIKCTYKPANVIRGKYQIQFLSNLIRRFFLGEVNEIVCHARVMSAWRKYKEQTVHLFNSVI